MQKTYLQLALRLRRMGYCVVVPDIVSACARHVTVAFERDSLLKVSRPLFRRPTPRGASMHPLSI